MKTTDDRIDEMTVALRRHGQSAPPESHFLALTQERSKGAGRPRRLAVVALCATLALGLVLLPRRSPASELQALIEPGRDVPVHVVHSQLTGTGWTVTQEMFALGDRVHLLPSTGTAETYLSGMDRYDLDPSGYVVHSKIVAAHGEAFFEPGSFHKLLQVNSKNIRTVVDLGRANWRGMTLEAFEINFAFTDALGQRLCGTQKVFADLGGDRPYAMQTTIKGGTRGSFVSGETDLVTWDYPASATQQLQVSWPAGWRVYDRQDAVAELKRAILVPEAIQTVAGIRVELRGAFEEARGALTVITSGGTGRIERGPGLKVNGPEFATSSAELNLGHWAGGDWKHGGKFVFEPLSYRGIQLVSQTALAEGQTADRVDLSVPVWKADHSRYGRSFVGYAEFKNVAVTRYAAPLFTDTLNRPVLAAVSAQP